MNKIDLKNPHGQSLIIIALMMMGMIAILGLVLDGGQAFVSRRQSQNASDAAAFAGVRVLATRISTTTESNIWNAILTYAQANGVASTDVTAYLISQTGANICRLNVNCGGIPTSPYPTGVRVTTTLRMQPYFIDLIIGNNPVPVTTVAAVQSGPGTGSPVMPMSLPFPCNYNPNDPDACPLVYGQAYTLTGASQLPGGFQWVDYSGGSSTTNLVRYLTQYWTSGQVTADSQDLCVPYPPTNPVCQPPTPSSWIPSSSGLSPDDKVRAALDAWLDFSKWGTGPGAMDWGPVPTSKKWTVPVFDTNCCTGSGAKYHVIFFAEFELVGYWFANNQCNWVGAPNHPNCNHLPTSPNTGWQLQNCADAGQPCILGTFSQKVTNMQSTPGVCNSIGIDICGYGLSQ